MALKMNLKQYYEKLGTKGLVSAGVTIVILAFFGLLPFVFDVDKSYLGYYIFISCVYLTVAQGWNLVAGYTGQISLGQNAFFGLGAYTMAMLWLHDVTKTYYFFDPVLMICAGIAPTIIAILIGIPLLSRLHGDYFSFGTLGMGMIINVLFVKGGDITGGANGVYLDASSFSNMRIYWWVSILVAFLATFVVYLITRSRIGLALRAIREDEISAASHGISVLKYKVLAFAVGAFMAGVAGSVVLPVPPGTGQRVQHELAVLPHPHGGPWRHRHGYRSGDRCADRERTVRLRRHLLRRVSPHRVGSADHPGHEVYAGWDHEHHRQGAHALAEGRRRCSRRCGREIGRTSGSHEKGPVSVVETGPLLLGSSSRRSYFAWLRAVL
jgi:branched-chain amino acid transport system permease protein